MLAAASMPDLRIVETLYFDPEESRFKEKPTSDDLQEKMFRCAVIIDPNKTTDDPIKFLTNKVQFLFPQGFSIPDLYAPPNKPVYLPSHITNNVTCGPSSITSSLKQLSLTLLAGAVMGACVAKFGFRFATGIILSALNAIKNSGSSYTDSSSSTTPENPQQTDSFNKINLFSSFKKNLPSFVAKAAAFGLFISSLVPKGLV
jgi:hypothetical protein